VKHLLWIAAGLVLTAVIAAMILRQTKGDAHARDLATAVLITLASAELSMIPMMLVRRAGPVAHFQAAFGGTVLPPLPDLRAGGDRLCPAPDSRSADFPLPAAGVLLDFACVCSACDDPAVSPIRVRTFVHDR